MVCSGFLLGPGRTCSPPLLVTAGLCRLPAGGQERMTGSLSEMRQFAFLAQVVNPSAVELRHQDPSGALELCVCVLCWEAFVRGFSHSGATPATSSSILVPQSC